MNVPRTYPGGETFHPLGPNFRTKRVKWNSIVRSGAICFKFGTMVEDMPTHDRAKLHDDRCTMKDAIPFHPLGPNPIELYRESIRTKRVKWNNSSCSDAIDLKFSTIVEGMYTYVSAEFHGDRSSTNEAIPFHPLGPNIRTKRVKCSSIHNSRAIFKFDPSN